MLIKTIAHRVKPLLAISTAIAAVNVVFVYAALAQQSLQSGIQLYNSGKYSEALGIFESVQPTYADNATYRYYLANTMVKLNLKKDAIREYKLARDLGQGNQISQYAEMALKQLELAPSGGGTKGTPVAAATTIPTAVKAKWQEPLLVAFMAGKNDTTGLDDTLAKVFARFGEQVSIRRVDLYSEEPDILKMRDMYKIATAPSILLFDDQGQIFKRYVLQIDGNQLAQDVASIAGDKSQKHFTNANDERLSHFRFAQMSDAYAKINNAERDLQSRLKSVDEEIENRKSDLLQSQMVSNRRYQVANNNASDMQQELIPLQRKRQQLIFDFQNQKRGWLEEANERIKAMENSR